MPHSTLSPQQLITMDMSMNMSMCLYWSYECYFVLKQLETNSLGMFLLGCFMTFVFSILSMGSKMIKQAIAIWAGSKLRAGSPQDIQPLNSSRTQLSEGPHHNLVGLKVMLSMFYLYYSVVHILLMLLIMTMNGYVIISIILGMTVGKVVFEQQEEETHNHDLPVNCGCES